MKNGLPNNTSVQKYGSTKVQFQKFQPIKLMNASAIITIPTGIGSLEGAILFTFQYIDKENI